MKGVWENKRVFLLVCYALLFLSLVGCNSTKQEEQKKESETIEVAETDFMTLKVKWNPDVIEGSPLYIQGYQEWDHTFDDIKEASYFKFYAADFKEFITVIERIVQNGEAISENSSLEFFIERLNPVTGEISHESISKEDANFYMTSLEESGVLPSSEVDQIQSTQDSIRGILRLENGKILYTKYNSENNRVKLAYYDQNQKECKDIADLGDYKSNQVCCLVALSGTDLYYATTQDVICWNLITGDRESVFRLDDGALSSDGLSGVVGTDGCLYLRYLFDGEDGIYKLGKENVKKDNAVVMKDISTYSGSWQRLVETAAADYYRKYPQYSLSLEKLDMDKEAYNTRVMADVMSGNGPDILVVDRDTLCNLQEMGWTADLRDYLSEETIQELLPGVIDAGTTNGQLVGIAPEIDISCMFTKKSIWDQESWTINDFVELMKKNPDSQVSVIDVQGKSERSRILFNLVSYDIDNSEFIDWTNGKCHFDNDDFVELLECINTKSEVELSDKEVKDSFEDGQAIAMDAFFIPSFGAFVKNLDLLGEDYHLIGFPSNDKSANYLTCKGYVVVNKETKYKEEVVAYLELLLGTSEQEKCSFLSVRKNPLDPDRLYHYDDKSWSYQKKGSNKAEGFTSKSDVSLYMMEFNKLVEKCRLPGNTHYEVANIIEEEAAIFFEGGRSAKETAQIIQNRVQLYLDEN